LDTGILGAGNVARVLASLTGPFARIGGSAEPREVNGQPGAVFRGPGGRVINTGALDILDEKVQAIRATLNPDKLRLLGPVADARASIRETNEARMPDPAGI